MSGSLENCRRKVRCATSFDALAAAWRMQFKNPYAKINAYPCKYCDGWHIGNAYNRKDAKKALNRLARMMFHSNFFIKVPEHVRERLIAKRIKMEGFLAHRLGSEDEAKRLSGEVQCLTGNLPRWQRRRLVATFADLSPNTEFRGTSILPS